MQPWFFSGDSVFVDSDGNQMSYTKKNLQEYLFFYMYAWYGSATFPADQKILLVDALLNI